MSESNEYCMSGLFIERVIMSSATRDHLYLQSFVGKEALSCSREVGIWLLVNVDGGCWPEELTLIIYKEKEVFILPPEDGYYPAVMMNLKKSSFKDINSCKTFLMQFLSALVWVQNRGINIISWVDYKAFSKFSDSMRQQHEGPKHNITLSGSFRLAYLPSPKNDNARLALAFYREGLSLNHKGYAFLSLYKIINLKYEKGKKQKKWIKENIDKIQDTMALDRINEIKRMNAIDPCEYLYHSCRCAVAHAGENSDVYDPENLEDEIRFWQDYPVILQLARIMIEDEYGIKTRKTIDIEHKYELCGFSEILDQKIIEDLKQGKTLPRRRICFKENISLRLWNKPKFGSLENLIPKVKHAFDGKVELTLSDSRHLLKIPCVLDFPSEKLIIDPILNIGAIKDDLTPESACLIAGYYKFSGDLVCNGVLELWSSKSIAHLGRHNEYFPVNIMPYQSRNNFLKSASEWSQKAKDRMKPKTE